MSDVIIVKCEDLGMSVEFDYDTEAVEIIMFQGEEDPIVFFLKSQEEWGKFVDTITHAEAAIGRNIDIPHPHQRMEDC